MTMTRDEQKLAISIAESNIRQNINKRIRQLEQETGLKVIDMGLTAEPPGTRNNRAQTLYFSRISLYVSPPGTSNQEETP